MTKNASNKKFIRLLMEEAGIPYSEAKRRIEAPCDHYMIVGMTYSGDDAVVCTDCGLSSAVISNEHAQDIYLECEVHTLYAARLANNVRECMNSYGVGDEGDGPVFMSCEAEFPGWAD
ncbi:hypothetical protein ACLM5J_06745 [Nocardioides sp. Bht2]|uniref:hypothetical protein n=1 Tax=Nocardioides sp. Bht2 TaxID=3392297 RepID=UPI0039B5C8A6